MKEGRAAQDHPGISNTLAGCVACRATIIIQDIAAHLSDEVTGLFSDIAKAGFEASTQSGGEATHINVDIGNGTTTAQDAGSNCTCATKDGAPIPGLGSCTRMGRDKDWCYIANTDLCTDAVATNTSDAPFPAWSELACSARPVAMVGDGRRSMVATYSLADGSQTVLAVQGDAEPPLRRNRVALSGLNGTGLELYGRFRGGSGRGRGGWIRDKIKSAASAVIDVASSAVKAVKEGVKKVAKAVVETVKDVVSAAGSFMTGNQLMKIGQCIANLKTAAELRAAQSYSSYSAALIAGDMSVDLHALLDARADALAEVEADGMMSKWLGSVSDLAMELWAALKSIFKPGGPGLFTFLAQKASAVVEWLQKKLMGVMQNVGDLFQGLAGGFSSTSKQLSLLAEQSLHTHLYTTAVVTLADLNKTTEVQAEEEAQDLLGGIPARVDAMAAGVMDKFARMQSEHQGNAYGCLLEHLVVPTMDAIMELLKNAAHTVFGQIVEVYKAIRLSATPAGKAKALARERQHATFLIDYAGRTNASTHELPMHNYAKKEVARLRAAAAARRAAVQLQASAIAAPASGIAAPDTSSSSSASPPTPSAPPPSSSSASTVEDLLGGGEGGAGSIDMVMDMMIKPQVEKMLASLGLNEQSVKDFDGQITVLIQDLCTEAEEQFDSITAGTATQEAKAQFCAVSEANEADPAATIKGLVNIAMPKLFGEVDKLIAQYLPQLIAMVQSVAGDIMTGVTGLMGVVPEAGGAATAGVMTSLSQGADTFIPDMIKKLVNQIVKYAETFINEKVVPFLVDTGVKGYTAATGAADKAKSFSLDDAINNGLGALFEAMPPEYKPLAKPVLQMLPQILTQYFPAAEVQTKRCKARLLALKANIMQSLDCNTAHMQSVHQNLLAAYDAERQAKKDHAVTRARHQVRLRSEAHLLLADVSRLQ